MRTWVQLAAVAGLAAAGGCNPPPGPEPKVEDATFATLDAAVKAHKGDVVLVDFWATWCVPCVQKFPYLVTLHDRYAGRGLRVISVSLDKADNADAVRRFLRDRRATFENYQWANYRDDAAAFQEHFAFAGGIPHMVAFDRTGKRVWDSNSYIEANDRDVSPAVLDELVRNLLDAK